MLYDLENYLEIVMQKVFMTFLLLLAMMRPQYGFAQPAELMLAARNGDIEAVSALLASGAEPDPEGIATPLYFAAQAGYLEIANLLLEAGADPNAQSRWGSPLQIAARRGHVELVKLLLVTGAEPNLAGGEFENTPLHETAETGDVEIGRLLIDQGADVNVGNKNFEPPIHLAVSAERDVFAELLREAGAAANPVDPISSSELANADIESGRVRAVECTNCHKLELGTDASGRYAPLLWGIVGREVAIASERENFPYSEAMKAQKGNWTYERLNAFLSDPYGTIPGTGMYAGLVRDRTQRINVIAFLRTLADDPVSLP